MNTNISMRAESPSMASLACYLFMYVCTYLFIYLLCTEKPQSTTSCVRKTFLWWKTYRYSLNLTLETPSIKLINYLDILTLKSTRSFLIRQRICIYLHVSIQVYCMFHTSLIQKLNKICLGYVFKPAFTPMYKRRHYCVIVGPLDSTFLRRNDLSHQCSLKQHS